MQVMNTVLKKKPTSVNKRVQQKQQTALVILAAAKKLFVEQGFAETTTRAIASEAGVGIGTVFAHYPDKINLLGQALRGEIGQVVESTYATIPKQQGLTNQLLYLSTDLLAYYIENHSLTRELIKYTTFQEGPEAEAFNEQMKTFSRVVEKTIENAVLKGKLNKKINVRSVAKNYMAIHFFIVNRCLRQSSPQLEEQITQMRAMVEALLLGYKELS